jgi:hypothetical protein
MWSWVVENWQFVVGTIIGVIGVVIAVATIVYQRQPKRLDYEIRSDIELIGPHVKKLREGLKIAYFDEPIEEPWVVIVRIRNTGEEIYL